MSYSTKVAVLYHSGYGHTVKVAQAVAQGAASVNGVAVDLVKAEEAHLDWSLLDNADAIIMGAPTYMGSLSAPFKAFMGGEECAVTPTGASRGTSVEALLPALLAGLAIAELLEFVAIQYLADSQLEPILTDWSLPEGGLYFVTPTARARPAKVSALALHGPCEGEADIRMSAGARQQTSRTV